MAGNEFNRLLLECVNSMYQNGHVSPALFVSGYGLNDGAQSVLMKLVELVMHTEYFKEDTKNYLSGKYLSFRSTVKDGCIEVNKSTRQSRIRYDLSKQKAALDLGIEAEAGSARPRRNYHGEVHFQDF